MEAKRIHILGIFFSVFLLLLLLSSTATVSGAACGTNTVCGSDGDTNSGDCGTCGDIWGRTTGDAACGYSVAGDLCCGDDANEYDKYQRCYTFLVDATACTSDLNIRSCCNVNSDCVAPDGYCLTSYTTAYDLDLGPTINWAWCAVGQWYDCDESAATHCSSKCGFDAAEAGEAGVGEYLDYATQPDKVECCGDDENEFYRDYSGTGGGIACCDDPGDAVNGAGNCVPPGPEPDDPPETQCDIVMGGPGACNGGSCFNTALFTNSGEIPDATYTQSCCGDDSSEYYILTGIYEACCKESDDFVNSGGACVTPNDDQTICSTVLGFDWHVGITYESLLPSCCGNDANEYYLNNGVQYACCDNILDVVEVDGSCTTQDSDDSQLLCDTFPGTVCSGLTCWNPSWFTASGETPSAYYESSCCGDDVQDISYKETFLTFNCYNFGGITAIACADDPNIKGCCDYTNDCVSPDGYCHPYRLLTTQAYNVSTTESKNYAYCYSAGIGWMDCDYNTGFYCDTECSNIGKRILGGESVPFGEYTDQITLGCCGDDDGEYYVIDGVNEACCDSPTDCVDGTGACYFCGVDPDADQPTCEASFWVWLINPALYESGDASCCGNDPLEFYKTNTTAEACCDQAVDYVDESTLKCIGPIDCGLDTSPAPCGQTERDGDQSGCEANCGATAWELPTGDATLTCGWGTDMCCGDDLYEKNLYLKCATSPVDSAACTTDMNVRSCCNNIYDCVTPEGTCMNTNSDVYNFSVDETKNWAWCASNTWYDCDFNNGQVCNLYCSPFEQHPAGEAGVGEYTDYGTNPTKLECCGDDENEFIVSGPGGTKCCDSPVDTVDISGNCVFAGCSANDAAPACGGTERDGDQINCEANCAGTSVWELPVGDSACGYGTMMCCGDDAGENVVIEFKNADATNDVAYVDGEYGCCDDISDCVSAQSPLGCYPSISTPGNPIAVDVNPGGNDTKILCYRNPSPLRGEWADCDNDDWMDWWCGDVCGPAKGKIGIRSGSFLPNPNWNAVISGEPWIGEYTLTDFTNRKLECCGDDTGEYYVDSTGLGQTPLYANRACCNDSSDFVWITGVTKNCCNPAVGEGNATAGCGTCTDNIDNDGDGLFDEDGGDNPALIDPDCILYMDCLEAGGFWEGTYINPYGDINNITDEIEFINGTDEFCCGDKANEYISRPHWPYEVGKLGSACHDSLGDFCSGMDFDDWGCCGDETYCYDGVGTCYTVNDRADVDGNGDTDTCTNEGAHGFWVDCLDGTDCPAGKFCVDYDCIPGSGWLDVGNNSLNDSILPGVSDDFGGSINYILRHGCTCPGCVINESDCLIPMIFYLDQPTTLTLDLSVSTAGPGMGVLVSAGSYQISIPYGEIFPNNKDRNITIGGGASYCFAASGQNQFHPELGICPIQNIWMDCTQAYISPPTIVTDSALDDALWRLWKKAAKCPPPSFADPWSTSDLSQLTIGVEYRSKAPSLFGPIPVKAVVWM
ncbi:MAG: hypothetical protein ABH950_02520 [Candidatus Altiarchaeota archaeon]